MKASWEIQIKFHVLLPLAPASARDSHECVPYVTSDERCIIPCNACGCCGEWGYTHELSIENRFSNRSAWTSETAWVFALPELSIFIAECSWHNIMLQCIFKMFSDLNFVCISRLFPVRAVCPTNLLFIYLVALIIFSKVLRYKLWLFASSSSFLFHPACYPRRLL